MVTLGIGHAHRRPKLPIHDVPDFLVPLTHSSPPPFNVAFFPNTQNKPALPLPPPPIQFIVYSFPLLLGASLSFFFSHTSSSPCPRQTPTNPNSSTSPPLFRFSNPPFLAPKDSFPQLLSSLNFSFRKSFLPLPTNSTKFGQIRKSVNALEFARNAAAMAHTRPRSAKKKTPAFSPVPIPQ